MVNKTAERIDKLAKEVAENMSLEDLLSFVKEIHVEHYEVNDVEFHEDWEIYME